MNHDSIKHAAHYRLNTTVLFHYFWKATLTFLCTRRIVVSTLEWKSYPCRQLYFVCGSVRSRDDTSIDAHTQLWRWQGLLFLCIHSRWGVSATQSIVTAKDDKDFSYRIFIHCIVLYSYKQYENMRSLKIVDPEIIMSFQARWYEQCQTTSLSSYGSNVEQSRMYWERRNHHLFCEGLYETKACYCEERT